LKLQMILCFVQNLDVLSPVRLLGGPWLDAQGFSTQSSTVLVEKVQSRYESLTGGSSPAG